MANEIPAEIAELRDLADTAASNLAMAEGAHEAAQAEADAAARKEEDAEDARHEAAQAEADARRDYIAALRRHGYVQTAHGPKPAGVQS